MNACNREEWSAYLAPERNCVPKGAAEIVWVHITKYGNTVTLPLSSSVTG